MEKDTFFTQILEELKTYQEQDPQLYGWAVTIVRKTSYQRLLYSGPENGLFPQTIRDNISEISYSMTLYVRHSEPRVMGNTSAKVDPTQPIIPQISEAMTSALVVDNPPWDLVKPGEEFPQVNLVDPALKNDPAGAADRLVEQADEACRSLEGVNVNYAEIFINYSRSLKITSTGLKMPSEASDIYFEIAMEKHPLPNLQEIHNNKGAVTLEGLQIGEFIRQAAAETQLLGDVVMPDTTDNAVLLIRSDVLNQIFHCLLSQLDAGRQYMQRPHIKPGDTVHTGILAGDSDTLNLKLDPFLDFMAGSTPFTGDGLKAKSGLVIKDNVVEQRYVSNRMSQYMDSPLNPVCGNVIVDCGTRSYKELTKMARRVIEIITFSSLLLSTDHLTYSSEIKLGREFNNETGKVRYLKGGVVSGNIKENLASCLFSNVEVKQNVTKSIFENSMGYRGPEYMLIRSGVAVAGI